MKIIMFMTHEYEYCVLATQLYSLHDTMICRCNFAIGHNLYLRRNNKPLLTAVGNEHHYLTGSAYKYN
jgi:hypothetical protein